MTNIIRNMSQVDVSDELLQQIDMKDLFDSFKKNYDKLGEFKNTRDQYEQRGVGKKLWDAISFNKIMENAQLDATEIQGEFSKILGQLTVVNIALSKQLNNQQEQLLKQQNIIEKQTAEIKSQTKLLNEQQNELESQNQELDKLIREYFELKGLTQEGAKKLITIAREIENTKNKLVKEVENLIAESKEWVSSRLSEIDSKIFVLENYVNDTQAKSLSVVRESQEFLSKQQEQTLGEVSLRMNTFEENINENLLSAKNEYKSSMSILNQEQTKQNENMINIQDNFVTLTDNFKNLTEDFKLYRNSERKKIQKLTIALGVMTVALFSITSYLYLFAH